MSDGRTDDDDHSARRPVRARTLPRGRRRALGLVAGDRIRPLSDQDLGAAALNDFLAEPDWDRLAALAEAARRSGCRSPTSR